MKTYSQIEVASYVSDLIFTLLFVFKNIVHPQSLLDWLRPMLMDDDQRAMLLHEEPLYVAADFLEVNRFAPEFREIEAAYLRFRNEYLTSSISDSKHQMDSSPREFLNMHDNPTPDYHRHSAGY